jgi:ATP-binding cassette, subfamily B, bacterial
MRKQLRLLRYIRPHWRDLQVILLTMMFWIGVDVLKPWPTKLLVDHILGRQPIPETINRWLAVLPGSTGSAGLLLWVCVSTVLIFLAGTLIALASNYASVRLGRRVTYSLGADLFLHLQRLSLLFHSRRQVGDMSLRVNEDAQCVQSLVTSALLPAVQSVVMLILMFAIMWRIEPTMTVLSLGVAPFMMLIIRIFGGRLKASSRTERDLEGRLSSLVQQSLGAIPMVQAYNREETEYDRFRRYAEETRKAHQRSVHAELWFKLLVGLVTSVGTASIMWLGGKYAIEGKVSVGSVLVFISYLGSLYYPLNSIACTASTMQSAAAKADRVIEILDTSPEVQNSPRARAAPLQGRVRYEDVWFNYDLDLPALKGVSFEARAGERVALVGPSGAGKTTLANLLVRFFDPSSGRVLIDGHDIRDLHLRSLREQVAMVLQEPFLFPVTVAENIAYGRPEATRDEIVEAAKAADAHDFIVRLPHGYDTVIGERGATLSGGQRQRISIARAFLKDAPILILDEPTSALDAKTERLLLDALDRLMMNRTTFIIAHRLSTSRDADRIIVLDQGVAVEQGRHSELMARDGLYTSLYRQQTAA